MKNIKILFLLTAFASLLLCGNVKGQSPQKFTNGALFLKGVWATNNSNTLSNSYFTLRPANQRIGIGLGNITPRAGLDVRTTFYDSSRVGSREFILNSGVTNRFGLLQGFYTLDYTDTTTWGVFYDHNSKSAILAYQDLMGSGVPEFEVMANPNLARIGKAINNDFKFGVTTNNNYTIINGYTDSNIAVFSDSAYNEKVYIQRDGTVRAAHLVCTQNASVMSVTAGSGAGTSPTVSVTGNDHAGSISLTTGTSCATAAQVIRVTYNLAFPGGFSSVVLTPANATTAALSGNKCVFVTPTGTYFDLTSGSTALSDGTTYAWNYVVLR